jgi:heat shock protein HslJ
MGNGMVTKKLRSFGISIGVAALLSACANPTPEPATISTQVDTWVGMNWVAFELDGTGPTASPKPSIRWTSPAQLAGSAGCNAFVGKTEVGPDGARFTQLVPVGKPCIKVTAQEDKFFKALEWTRKMRVEGGQMVLEDESGKTLMRLTKTN